MNKKAIIYNYHGQDFKSITGHDHNSEIPYEKVFEVAKDVFEKGLNVMVIQTSAKDKEAWGAVGAVLYIDDRNFKQR
jgi:hypothetical protein